MLKDRPSRTPPLLKRGTARRDEDIPRLVQSAGLQMEERDHAR
jgi:hypothetical protein